MYALVWRSSNFFYLFFAELPPSFAHAGVQQQRIAHPDAAVNEPIGKLNIHAVESFAPGKDMLVNAVDQGAVKVEEKRGLKMLVTGLFLLRHMDADLGCSFRLCEQP